MLSPDYSKRDYLLPEGCKDLIDVINLERQQNAQPPWLLKNKNLAGNLGALPLHFCAKAKGGIKATLGELPGVPPLITQNLLVVPPMTVGRLAELLGQKAATIIADLMLLGVFAKTNQVVGFEAIARVARKYGYAAKKP